MDHVKHKIAAAIVAIFAIIYIIMPVDALPEAFFPIVGYIDDLAVAILSIFISWFKDQA